MACRPAQRASYFGIRGGKVRHVAVTTPRTLARPRLLRRYLRAAGLPA